MIMFEIETKNLKISEELNRKIDMICRFACVKYEFIPGNIKSIKNTNIAYVKPHILKVKGNDYLILEECEEVFINGYNEKIKLKDLEKLIPSFKAANATIHFDESSPHLHIVGVPFKENCKTGMNRQVGKSDVFNVESLKDIQKELRESCIKEFNKVYNLNMELKEKKQGRNQDYRVSQMKDYDIFQRNYNKQQNKIHKVNSKTEVINEESKDIKEIINNLKQQTLNKN